MPTLQTGQQPPPDPARNHRPSVAEFIRGPWLPLVVTLPVVVLIIVAPGAPVGDKAELLKAFAAVIVALTGLITAAGRYHRR